MHTQWKDIPGYDGRYQASTDGQIRGCDRTYTVTPADGKKAYTRVHKGKVLRPCVGSNGYFYVGLRKKTSSDNATYLPVHHLIAITFLGARPDGAYICHKNGDKKDCRVDNLRYDTPRENHLDVYRCGGTYGKLSPDQVRVIKARLKAGEQQTAIAKDYGVSQTAIYYIDKGVHFGWL